jgi:hypothetical protein
MKKMDFSFLKFEMKISIENLKKKAISPEGNEEIIYFVYVSEMKLPIISMYHLCIPPYTTCGIQLISAVRSFHIGLFPTVL